MSDQRTESDKNAAPSGDSRDTNEEHSHGLLSETWEKFKRLFTDHEPHEGPKLLEEFTLNAVADLIQSSKVKNIVVMTGAGVSTSAGIPDFRSPDIGLYANMGKYNLPHPQAMFDINYFKYNPEPFFALAKELLPVRLKPTPVHYFLRLLHEKGLLLRVYTQNIDSLEHIAGLPEDKIIEAHGSFHHGHCTACHTAYDFNWLKSNIRRTTVPRCDACGKVVRPDVVLFGENLPGRFFSGACKDFPKCDLLLIMGTSLVVHPFAGLAGRVGKNVPRVLINKEKAGIKSAFEQLLSGSGLQYDSPTNHRDVFWQGTCDDGIRALARLLGWEDELEKLIRDGWRKLDDELDGNA